MDSTARAASFFCIASEKCVSLSTDSKLERAFQSLALKRHLEALSSTLPEKALQFMYLPGAGVAFDRDCMCSVEGGVFGVFAGHASSLVALSARGAVSPTYLRDQWELDNYAYLVNKYCLAAAKLDASRSWRLETLRELSPLTDAQVVVNMYRELGPTFMAKLKGRFCFLIYDAHLGRVLIANDASASFDVWQGHLQEDRSLIVGCDFKAPLDLLEGGHSVPIGASEYKFGWRSAPLAYGSSKSSISVKAHDAMSAAMAALAGCTPSKPVPVAKRTPAARPSAASPSWGNSSLSSSSYVPPHKRVSTEPRGWRRSVDVAQPTRVPFRPTHDNSLDFPSDARPRVVDAPPAQLAPPPEHPAREGERRSIPINIPLKAVTPAVPIGKPPSAAVPLQPHLLRTNSELSSALSQSAISSPGRNDMLYVHQDSQTSQLQFSVSSTSISQAAADAEAAAAAPSRAHAVASQALECLQAVPGSFSQWTGPPARELSGNISGDIGISFLGWGEAAADAPHDLTAISSWEKRHGVRDAEYLPSVNLQEAKRLLDHAAQHSGLTAPDVAGPAGKRTCARSAIESATNSSLADAPALLAAPVLPLAAAPIADAPFGIAAVAAERRASDALAAPIAVGGMPEGACDGPGAAPPPEITLAGGIGGEGSAARDRSLFGSLHVCDAPEDHLAAGASAAHMYAPLQPLGAIGESPENTSSVLSFSEQFVRAARAPEVPAATEVMSETPEGRPAETGVGTSVARLNRAVEEANMAREVTRLMTQGSPLGRFPGVRAGEDNTGQWPASAPPVNPALTHAASPSVDEAPDSLARLVSPSDVPSRETMASPVPSARSSASTASHATPSSKPSGMGMRVGSFPMALAQLLRGRSSPNLLATASSGASPAATPGGAGYLHSSLRPAGASPACNLSPASSSAHLGRIRSGLLRSPLQAPSVPPDSLGSAHASAAGLRSASNASVLGSRTPSLTSLTDSATLPSSPRAALPLGHAVQKLPADLLDELAGGVDAEPEVKAMLANLLYSSPCSLCIVDATANDHPIIYVNAVFELQTGYTFEEVAGRNCRFLQVPPGEPITPTFQSLALRRAVAMGRSHACKMLNYAKDGSPMWNQLSIVPVRQRAGSITHYVGMQSFSPAHRPAASSAALGGVKARQRSGSYAVLPSLLGAPSVGHVPRSSSHAMLEGMGGFNTPPAMVS